MDIKEHNYLGKKLYIPKKHIKKYLCFNGFLKVIIDKRWPLLSNTLELFSRTVRTSENMAVVRASIQQVPKYLGISSQSLRKIFVC